MNMEHDSLTRFTILVTSPTVTLTQDHLKTHISILYDEN
jgi:hypothetical protein